MPIHVLRLLDTRANTFFYFFADSFYFTTQDFVHVSFRIYPRIRFTRLTNVSSKLFIMNRKTVYTTYIALAWRLPETVSMKPSRKSCGKQYCKCGFTTRTTSNSLLCSSLLFLHLGPARMNEFARWRVAILRAEPEVAC
jgi:hypothetical protein